jgi:hypothetical protein
MPLLEQVPGRRAMTREAGPDRRCMVCALALFALAGLLLPHRALAAPPFLNGQLPRPEPQTLVQPGPQTREPGISREQAAGMVQRRTGGRVLSTTPVQRGGGIVGYDVRVLVDGKRVKNVFVDERGAIRGAD